MDKPVGRYRPTIDEIIEVDDEATRRKMIMDNYKPEEFGNEINKIKDIAKREEAREILITSFYNPEGTE